MKRLFLIFAVLGCSFLFAGCDKDHDDDFEEVIIYPFTALGIPYGHLPPPGECKIWIPGLPPGQQGPPQSCESAMFHAPLGAWVIARANNWYEIHVISDTRPPVVVETRYYALP
ncbi:hypothetical protein [Longitalea luteola]|uniref:hypothetical protein n=1 Tax=Longitalea luteola TaxID=2812563 RepID=UPI001A979F10|nr:hypothetical protein [Longitalea luteola]